MSGVNRVEFPFIWLFISSFAVSIVTMPLARRFGSALGLLDHPHERKLQDTAIPRTGGIGILAGLIAGLAVLMALSRSLGVPLGRDILGICLGGIVIHATGVLDDLCDLPARLKLLAQSAAVAIAMSLGVWVEQVVLPGGTVIELGWAGIPLTAFFLLGIVNSINLVDGLDGLASGIAGIAALALGIAGVLSGNAVLGALSLVLLGAVGGFLPYNFLREGKTFLGDSGSMLLGWMLGVIAITGARFGGDSTALFLVLAAVTVPVFDTTTTIIRRARSRQALFSPDSMHIHHRLIRFGMTPRQTVITILGITLFSAAQSLAMFVEGTRPLLVSSTLAVALVVLQVRRPRKQRLIESEEASFREILLYLLGTQKGSGPRMNGELTISDLLRPATNGAGNGFAESPVRQPAAVEREPIPITNGNGFPVDHDPDAEPARSAVGG
ncbi:undecaprenyl/decaprenyl-phosphate alpha-N-acetylglucosaminyl 1-phosphate transferase [bacterium]|nr:undecaprenyl/decaprenyl-phosphate alpha-N-acetylglucosaminyl 1-phosphate transferase [bacterium]